MPRRTGYPFVSYFCRGLYPFFCLTPSPLCFLTHVLLVFVSFPSLFLSVFFLSSSTRFPYSSSVLSHPSLLLLFPYFLRLVTFLLILVFPSVSNTYPTCRLDTWIHNLDHYFCHLASFFLTSVPHWEFFPIFFPLSFLLSTLPSDVSGDVYFLSRFTPRRSISFD